ncbi:MAG: beta-ketoacyl synthase N-terminal-like domain-containing protein [Salegentibacter sp.]
MKNFYLLEDSIISPLGFSTEANLEAIREERSGLRRHTSKLPNLKEVYAGTIDVSELRQNFEALANPSDYTKLEQMMILAIHGVISKMTNFDPETTALVISTTKGNIDLLGTARIFPAERVKLHVLGKVLQDFFGFKKDPVIVSNACISGGLALAVAKRLMKIGSFEQAIVAGGDLVSEFVVSGFNSFQALSNGACQPYSANRKGINLGEGAAAVLLSAEKRAGSAHIKLIGEASANDANHISGPSRTGEGLLKSIRNSMKIAGVSSGEINFLSAHGTATIYNDEMEAIAFNRAGLQQVPVNSLKGYYGHTLGASALIESIIAKNSMLNNELYASLNFDVPGTSKALNIIKNTTKSALKTALKTASGFGGCNLALVFQKEEDE